MNDSLIQNTGSLLGGLTGYFLSKQNSKIDRVPAMLIGGFVGGIVGGIIAKSIKKDEKICY
ncbi:MAG: hypothetical protein JXR60_11565 [Bacteroidales bacterium]|nr:hypothetical protein [Bacteroidales bacterium]